ncbi:MAG: glutathione S-transferase [Proteobacteria bacterium]|nr:glutathione S-transferase [Pseudomonadota bacterium]
MRLYDFHLSGNAHKVRNLLSVLGVEHERVNVDLLAGEQRAPEFLTLNPFGKVPVLVDGDVVLRDSSAIAVYLGRKFGRGEWLPVDAEGEARVQEWLAICTGEVANAPGFARLITVFGAEGDLEEAQQKSHALLERFEEHLSEQPFLAGERPTIADITNYSYIALAPDGGVELGAYPAIRGWLERLEKLPGFEPAPQQPA